MTLPTIHDPRQIRHVKTDQLPVKARRELKARYSRLYSRRDRFGTIRADFVRDFRFRVRSHVILEGLPMAPLILYLFARQTDWQQSFQGSDVRESCLEFPKRKLLFNFGSITCCQGSFQPHEVTPKLKLRQHLPAQGPERLQLLRAQLPRYTVNYAQGSECLATRH